MQLHTALRLHQFPAKPTVALSGAGGKSTLLFRLGHELARRQKQVLLTATTQLWTSQIDQAPFTLIAANPHLLAKELPISLRGYRQVLVMAGPAPENKLRGLAPETIDRLLALDDVDAAVVESDGSRERPLKAPAAHEPLIPACTTHLLVVASLVALDKPLDSTTVHRPELAAPLAELRPGDTITPAAIARLLIHPQGGLKGRPDNVPAALYLNLASDSTRPPAEAEQRCLAAQEIARLVLAQPGYDAVLIGGAAAPDPVAEVHSRIAAIILAAGRSSRLEQTLPKQLLPWGRNNTLLGRVVELTLSARSIGPVLVVTGHRASEISAAIQARPIQIVHNPNWQAGQSSSVQAALRTLPEGVSAAIFLLADQPAIRPATLDALVHAHRQSLAPIIAPRYADGRWGNPVLFDRSTFPELQALTGDTGGRPLIHCYGDAVQYVPIDQERPADIDTLADYQRSQPS